MAITGHTISVPGGGDVTIYAETANINYFLNTPLTPDTKDGPTNSATQVASHSRRQYPGDTTPISVSASTREYLVDPTRTKGRALPGRSFVLRERGGNKELRAFTFKGRWMDLHAYLSGEVSKPVFAYGPTGAKSTIDAVAD